MKYVCVIPYVWRPYFDEFIATCKIPPENMLIIDNTQRNTGIMASHNQGIDFMHERDADWLIVISAGIRFGEKGGLDFLDIVEQHPELHLINGAGKWGDHDSIALGWHLTAFRRDILYAVGRWDENFTPYGFDDVDLTLRIRKYLGAENVRIDSFPVDMEHISTSHSIQLAGVQAPSAPRIQYFVEKWGRHPGAWEWEGWEYPFNNPEHDIRYWPQAPNGGKWDD